jgi:hypothetical protein
LASGFQRIVAVGVAVCMCTPARVKEDVVDRERLWPVRLAGGRWVVLICSEIKVLLAGCWWLVCSEGKVLLTGG